MNGPLAPYLEVLPVRLIEKPYFLILSRKLAAGNPALAQRLWKSVEEVRTSPAYQKHEHDSVDAIGK